MKYKMTAVKTVVLLLTLVMVAPSHAGQWFIPAAAHNDGALGSQWRTKLIVNNFGQSAEVLTITLLPQDADNLSLDIVFRVLLAVGETLEIDDVLAWADLYWDDNLTGLEFIPVGTLEILIPYSAEFETTITAVATFDGSEWVLVQARLGAWQISFYVNIYTGEVRMV